MRGQKPLNRCLSLYRRPRSQCWRTSTTPALGEHWDQGFDSFGRSLRQGPGRTVNTMPEGTLKAFAEHAVGGATTPADGRDCEEVLARVAEAKIDSSSVGQASRRRRQVVRQFVERLNGRDWVQIRPPRASELVL
jgi:hypothetical protein